MENAARQPPEDRRHAPMLALPASCVDVLVQAVSPALQLLPKRLNSAEAALLVLVAGYARSAFATRIALGSTGRGLWAMDAAQVFGVMRHLASAQYCKDLCELRGVAYAPSTIYKALANDDVFAAGIARLHLWADFSPLPKRGDVEGAWMYHVRNFREPQTSRYAFNTAYQRAIAATEGA